MNLIWIIVIGTSIWVWMDAKSIGEKKGHVQGLADLGPTGWLYACQLLWIVAFPIYLAKRDEFKKINGK